MKRTKIDTKQREREIIEASKPLRQGVARFAAAMDKLQRDLLWLGLAATAQKVNDAQRKLGYEAADLLKKIARAELRRSRKANR